MAQGWQSYVARILGPDGNVWGTGTLLAGGRLLTCAHVIADVLAGRRNTVFGGDVPSGAVSIDLKQNRSRVRKQARLDGCIWGPARHPDNPSGVGDYAILRLPADDLPAGGLQPIRQPIIAPDLPFTGLGFPAGDEEHGASIDVQGSDLCRSPDHEGLITLHRTAAQDGFVRPGHSGGPIVMESRPAMICGMIKAIEDRRKHGVHLAFSIPPDVLHDAWQDALDQTVVRLATLESAEAARIAGIVEALSHDPKTELPTVLDQFRSELAAKLNQLPEPFSQGYIKARMDRLGRHADRVDRLSPDMIGQYVLDLIELDTALRHLPDDLPFELEPLMAALAGLASALQATPSCVSDAVTVVPAGWPPNSRVNVREAAKATAEFLEGLHETEHADPALHMDEAIGYIEDQTYLDKPNWPVMARNAALAGDIAGSLGNPFQSLADTASDLRSILKGAQNRMINALAPGSVFRDLPDAPEMIVIPACPGGFCIGSAEGEPMRSERENPPTEPKRIPDKFALARYALTFDEYDAYVDACADRSPAPEKPDDEGWDRSRRPVIDVSWKDAKSYLAWLSERTGASYRLPSEAEWEYACRGDQTGQNTTPFNPKIAQTSPIPGDWLTAEEANFDANYTYEGSPKGEYREQTVPVDHSGFGANEFGLWQMHGNVYEWCEDVFEESYDATPTDGSAHLPKPSGDAGLRVVRGGAWYSRPQDLRSANCFRSEPDYRNDSLGFRPARTLFTP